MQIASVNISEKKGTVKHPVSRIVLNAGGVDGDAHAGAWHRQVSLLGRESIDRFIEDTGRPTTPGEFAENITTEGMDLGTVAILDRFSSGDVLLEVTQIGKKCHGDACEIFRQVGKCVMPREGIFCRVLQGGELKAGDKLNYSRRPFKVRIVTLSDRASRGEYEDRSGPTIGDILDYFFADKRWHAEIDATILSDDGAALKARLEELFNEGYDVVITTGGTGVGPRDVTPEIVSEFCDRTIPGIMESIRTKFGREKPNALLSRSVAGARGRMLVYALPGSVKAVKEYMGEILKTLEHLVFMLHGLDNH